MSDLSGTIAAGDTETWEFRSGDSVVLNLAGSTQPYDVNLETKYRGEADSAYGQIQPFQDFSTVTVSDTAEHTYQTNQVDGVVRLTVTNNASDQLTVDGSLTTGGLNEYFVQDGRRWVYAERTDIRSVTSFDGTTHAATASAVNSRFAAMSADDVLDIAPGSYTLPERLIVPADDITVVCRRGTATLTLAGGVDNHLLTNNGYSGVRFLGLTLDHNGANQSTGHTVRVTGAGAEDVWFQDVELKNGRSSNLRIDNGATLVRFEQSVCRDWAQATDGSNGIMVAATGATDTECIIRDSDLIHSHTAKGGGYGTPVGFADNANSNLITGCLLTGGSAKGIDIISDHNQIGENLYWNTAGSAFEINGGSYNQVAGGKAYSTADNGFSIYNGATWNEVDGFEVYQCDFNGISISGGANGGAPTTEHNVVRGAVVYDPGQAAANTYYGVRIQQQAQENDVEATVYAPSATNGALITGGANFADDNRLDITVVGCQEDGVVVTSGAGTASGNRITGAVKNGGQVNDGGTYAGVYIFGSNDTVVRDLVATDDQGAKTQTYGVRTGGGQSGTRLLDCDLEGNATGAASFGSDNHVARVRDCIGFVTEAEGVDSVADGGTIAHGLDVAPTVVILTPSAAGHIPAATSVDGTNITVSLQDDAGAAVGAAENVYWRAKKAYS